MSITVWNVFSVLFNKTWRKYCRTKGVELSEDRGTDDNKNLFAGNAWMKSAFYCGLYIAMHMQYKLDLLKTSQARVRCRPTNECTSNHSQQTVYC